MDRCACGSLPVVVVLAIGVPVIVLVPVVSVPLAIVTVLTIRIPANLVRALVPNVSGTGVVVALSVLTTVVPLAALIVGVDRECVSCERRNGQEQKVADEGAMHFEIDL